ncbi:Ppx/GppA family phosphatase [Liquorilactobacillus satsumensis]|uniref:Ppx/GppA family phosphatase n=1 Tax=Liquorilactobacillus satsumensis TaxID=259059 RepID=UPI001E433CE0|nr:Ppx/GppA family phosphatase [Liquorilactobacillus satsumensis]MCC7667936.1 exopolyphosphatase [Liquorilactobacillus satsumensis]MCP9357067.1 Ppx/GppA family phosphatase [Liquorilactobacillus satsumensis]MCP9371014.1 Ppx/GppA family phosphatase [Liquorilactobacillus satsumensis]
MINFAVIDLGSNSVRMTITQIKKDASIEVTHQLKEMVRLSENMGPKKILQAEPIERTLNALKEFKKIYAALPNVHIEALATAAVRQAVNQADFLKLVKKEIGLNFQVITGRREAYLDFLGVTKTLAVGDNCLIIDTGGASTELILVKDQQVRKLISLPFGSVTISQTFNLNDEIKASDLFLAMTAIEKELTDVNWLFEAHKSKLVVLGGSNRTLAKIARRKLNLDPLPDLHGFKLPSQNAFEIFANLVDRDRKEREKISGLSKVRADVIVGGLIPISLILRTLHIPEILFSNHGLREGAFFDYLETSKLEVPTSSIQPPWTKA